MGTFPAFLLLLLLCPLGTPGTPPRPPGGVLYPFGPEVGDVGTPREDDGMSPPIPLPRPFPFYGNPQSVLYVNNNGVLSFGEGVPEFTPEPFPLGGGRPPLVAAFWGDVDTRLGGEVLYRQSRDPPLLTRLARDLLPATTPGDPPPKPDWAFVATWDRVRFFGSASDKANTFQAVLVTSPAASFVVLNFGDLQWTSGIADGGDPQTGLGGTPAQVGFDSGDSRHFVALPGSHSPRVLGVLSGSNVGWGGRWVFRVDPPAGPRPPPSPPETEIGCGD